MFLGANLRLQRVLMEGRAQMKYKAPPDSELDAMFQFQVEELHLYFLPKNLVESAFLLNCCQYLI